MYLWGVAAPLYDTHGMITGAIESIRDITERINLEHELNKKSMELARTHEEITTQNEEILENFGEETEKKM